MIDVSSAPPESQAQLGKDRCVSCAASVSQTRLGEDWAV